MSTFVVNATDDTVFLRTLATALPVLVAIYKVAPEDVPYIRADVGGRDRFPMTDQAEAAS